MAYENGFDSLYVFAGRSNLGDIDSSTSFTLFDSIEFDVPSDMYKPYSIEYPISMKRPVLRTFSFHLPRFLTHY